MSPQWDSPHSEISAAQDPVEQWPHHRHPKRKRRRFSRRKTKKIVKITLIVAAHIIVIALLIYSWTKFAYSSAKTDSLSLDAIAMVTCAGTPDNNV
jgi:hypothetical protein